MKLQDLKTTEELFAFAKALKLYKVSNEYPFQVDEVNVIRPLTVMFYASGEMAWRVYEDLKFSTCDVFDSYNDAKKSSIERQIAYNKDKIAQAEKELEELEGDKI